jgi:transcription termination factor NusB
MIKPNPKITDDIEKKLIQCRADYEACREIITLKENPGWVRVRAIIQANMGALKAQREDFQKINEHGLRFILKEEQDMDFFLSLVDGCDERMETLQQQISELQSKVNERKHKPVTTGPIAGI